MAARTTAKVATLTGAAKNDLLGGGTEDATASDLAVLGNDPGSARLWSLDQGVSALGGGTQVGSALDGSFELASGAVISANGDGTIHYDGSGMNLQYLAEGEIYTDTFIYTVRMANGALSTASVSVEVVGVNDIAVITGDDEASVTEDSVLSASGSLQVTDVDHDQSAFGLVGDLAGDYGDFVFDAGTGEWAYTLRNGDANVQALNAGDIVYDTLDIASLDGSASVTITVEIKGADEPSLPPPVNDVTQFHVNYGQTDVNGHQTFVGFDDNDLLQYSGNYDYIGYWFVDTDTDGDSSADSTVVAFEFQTGSGPKSSVEVLLLGYMGFTEAQLG